MKQRKDSVSTPCIAYDRMAERWELIHDLLGGTLAMRAARSKWLPSEEAESASAYLQRLARAVLFPAFRSAVQRIVSKPFSRAVTATLPPRLEPLVKDADGAGRTLSQLAREVFTDLVVYGKAHLLVDYAAVGGELNLAEEESLGLRPTIARVPVPDLIGWDFDGPRSTGLARIRIRESSVEKDEASSYLDKPVERVRVIERDAWQLWEKLTKNDEGGQAREDWVLVGEGSMSLGLVPLVTIYANQTGPLQAEPPLEDLAWLNLAHWQSDSDQRNILRVSRFAILFARGFRGGDDDDEFVIGPFNMVKSRSEAADLRYVEHQGTAIAAGREDLRGLEQRMELLGMAPFVERSSQSTATGKAIDHDAAMTQVQEWVRALEDGLRDAFSLACRWIGIDSKDITVDVFNDFSTLDRSDDLDFLLRAVTAGKLSLQTFLGELKRRGQLGDGVDPTEELERIAEDDAAGLPDPVIEEGDEDEDEEDGEEEA